MNDPQTKPAPSHARPGTPGAAATPAEHKIKCSDAASAEEKNRLAQEASREEDA